ncbi:hypothetical protein [Streptomyces sp. S1D4-14]|uniref:hypothetical protein n=1 Tax=Streptomyces sp. S1D4-14 TaxID=2594461 RepID=UPI0011626602|nr:hypothetical protein [Streptomyces sp. S1D4-14]QDN64392.1 hypothetical protein FNV66_00745 [Streptomyces sp. S1D4-14]
MEETRLRAVIREEIALAMKALKEAADRADMPYETGELESSALRAIGNAVDCFHTEYKAMCEWTDGERKRLTDPFTGEAPDVASCDHFYPRNPDGTWSNTCKNCGAGQPHKHEYAWVREAGQMCCVHCERPEPE